ncbi:MAG TPA: ribonuclease HII [Acidimicrobiales bacterium]
MKVLPTNAEEESLFSLGACTVAGVDEVGRGAWAGPVSVGVVVVTRESIGDLPPGVADSKLLSPAVRERLFAPLSLAVAAYAVGHASAAECDELGMTKAQGLATARAFEQLALEVDAVIVDGKTDFTGRDHVRAIVGADRSCVAVAAASVLAKVTRDRMMIELAPRYPGYAFEQNKGYPSPNHRAGLSRLGLSEQHRASWSFAPAFDATRPGSTEIASR